MYASDVLQMIILVLDVSFQIHTKQSHELLKYVQTPLRILVKNDVNRKQSLPHVFSLLPRNFQLSVIILLLPDELYKCSCDLSQVPQFHAFPQYQTLMVYRRLPLFVCHPLIVIALLILLQVPQKIPIILLFLSNSFAFVSFY